MLKNYLTIALRNMGRNISTTVISVAGLAVGMTVFILIMIYVNFESSYDTFHENYNRIYKVEREDAYSTGSVKAAVTPAPLGAALLQNTREIRDAVTLGIVGPVLVSTPGQQKKFHETQGLYAGNSFFEIFTFPLVKGDPATALKAPLSIVLTEKMAQKYFPADEPLGKILRIEKRFDCQVTGVVKSPPPNSYLKFDFILSFSSYPALVQEGVVESWHYYRFHTYVLLHPHRPPAVVNREIRDLPKKYIGPDCISTLYLKPFSELHLHSTQYSEGDTGSWFIVYLFAIIAGLTLVIAAINFMNLTTAHGFKRAKEVGIRKVVGSGRISLVAQFITESVVISLISAAAALILAALFLPGFNQLLNKQLKMSMLTTGMFPLVLLAIPLVVGMLSGSYPAFYLSSFRPIRVLRGASSSGKKQALSRKILISFQFFVSVFLIIGSIIVYQQFKHLKQLEVGFEIRHIMAQQFNNLRGEPIDKYRLFKNEWLKNVNVLQATISDYLPGLIFNSTAVHLPGMGENEAFWFNDIQVDEDFFTTYAIPLKQGRNFSRKYSTDQAKSCIINETALRTLGWENNPAISPLGQKIMAYNRAYTVIGVVKDFNTMGFETIKPLMLRLLQDRLDKKVFLSLKLKAAPGEQTTLLQRLRSQFDSFFPEDLFDLRFFDETAAIKGFFSFLDNIFTLVGVFAILAIFISALGLFAMAAHSVQLKTKEIGIRKVFGAPTTKIVLLLIREYIRILAAANFVAWALAYLFADRLLQQFPYRIPIHWWVFLTAGMISAGIALLTISTQILRAARTNPVNTIKHE